MATRSKRTPRLDPETRREQLLDSALAELADTGFGQVTVEAIAQRAGVTRPVIYDTFGDLDSLLHALIERTDARVSGQIGAILGRGIPTGVEPDQFLLERLAAFLAAVRSDPRSWRLALMPPAGTSADLNFRLQRVRAEIAARLRALLEWGINARGGPHGLDLELTARLFVSVGEDAARLMLAHPRRFSPDRLATSSVDLLRILPAQATIGSSPPERPEIAVPAPVAHHPEPPPTPEAKAEAATDGPPARRQRMPQSQRREQLLDVALELVAEEGFGALSMEAIARRAGVNRVVIYRSFANLPVLVTALMHREDVRVRTTLNGLLPQNPLSGEPVREVLYDAVHQLLAAVSERPNTWRLALLRPESAPRVLQRIVNRRRAALARRIEPLVGFVLADTHPNAPDYTVEAVARMLLTIGEEQGRLALNEPDAFPPARLLRATWRYLEAIRIPE